MLGWAWNLTSKAKGRFEDQRRRQRWAHLQSLGMHIGQGVYLPDSTWVDTAYCFLISIGDWCGFGPECVILAHDAQMDEFLDAGLIGRVTIRESCHLGTRTVVLPGVEIGPRTIVGANSVVSRTLPPETVCAGIPAKVVCTLEQYLARHRENLAKRPRFSCSEYGSGSLTPERRAELIAAVADGDAYITGGFSEELRGGGDTPRTGFVPGTKKPG
ncbi:MAG TPA: acyltransferase [Terriglobia bacterium]|nr:acyltransferase [Terriglobia bacterium]